MEERLRLLIADRILARGYDLLAAAQTCPVEAVRLPGVTESPLRQTRAEPSTTSAEHEEQ